MKDDTDLLPVRWLREVQRTFPSAWREVKLFREDKGKGLPDWPDWCYLPIAAGVAIVSRGAGDKQQAFRRTQASPISPALVVAAAAWRVGQGIYRFDADVFNALVAQPLDGDLPCETLFRLPEWCVYVESYGIEFFGAPAPGFFACLEHDANDGRAELRLLLLWEDSAVPVALHIGGWTIEESIRRMSAEAAKNATDMGTAMELPGADIFSRQVAPFVQLVLYLCAQNADMPVRPVHPAERLKHSGQDKISMSPRVWDVGIRTGAAIRRYRNIEAQEGKAEAEAGTHASPRPHIRRAHWHHFWQGAEGDRRLVLKWLPPIPVNIDEDTELPATIHKVE